MGLFDSVIKAIDAIEDGAIEKRVTQGLDKVEQTLDGAVKKGEKLADSSENMVKKASQLADQADKAIDKLQKKSK
jgi:hypothetical protein